MEVIFSTLINGLSLGGIYAMIALGYTMVYGIAKMLNFAHGDVIMVGGYLIFVFMATNNPLLAIILSVLKEETLQLMPCIWIPAERSVIRKAAGKTAISI